jgi:transcriptional regulator with XRE-family HTH domain
VSEASTVQWTPSPRQYKITYVVTAETRDRLGELAHEARSADVRLDNAVAARILDGATQVEVARILGVSQSAVSQTLRRRRERTIGPYWTIPVLAGRLARETGAAAPSILRSCAQFVSDFRRIGDPIDREAALGTPEATGAQRLDCLVAGLADREARRAGLATPEWAVSARYDLFPSWFVTSSAGLTAWLLRVTPPEFSARGVFLDPSELESV